MTYFNDLDLVRYHDGPCCADDWQCPLLAIGWLERGHDFPTGICPEQVTGKLAELRRQFGSAFPAHSFRGLHACSLCDGTVEWLHESHINLFIPGREVVYLVTGRVDHYIDAHSYAPPAAFIDAVLTCPDPRSAEYRKTLLRLNREQQPPLYL
jgi:hypothetical protein